MMEPIPEYNPFLEQFNRLHDRSGKPIDIDVQEHAARVYAMSVLDPLIDLQFEVLKISRLLKNKDASYFMLHGAGRRLRMIGSAYTAIIQTAPPRTRGPLNSDEASELTRDINVIYINLRGVLDNLAWSLLYESVGEVDKNKIKSEVGLFSSRFRKLCGRAQFWREISTHEVWEGQVKRRRDPSAHRIPLYIPPSIVSDAEKDQIDQVHSDMVESLKNFNLDKAEHAILSLERFGTYFPFMVHHPADGIVPIYPTLPEDLAHLISIFHTVASELRLDIAPHS